MVGVKTMQDRGDKSSDKYCLVHEVDKLLLLFRSLRLRFVLTATTYVRAAPLASDAGPFYPLGTLGPTKPSRGLRKYENKTINV